jgi:broad specificity polyphosphatase/5'/3'-nucleotidase SurE
MNDLITEQEIATINSSAKRLNPLILATLVPVIPTVLKSGYKVGITIDESPNMKPFKHLSIYIPSNGDHADADRIAIAVLGKDCIIMGIMYNKSITHYVQSDEKAKLQQYVDYIKSHKPRG